MLGMSWEECILAVESRSDTARARYGAYASMHEVAGVLLEEFNEMMAECHKSEWRKMRFELLDIAAVCIRAASEPTVREQEGQI